MPHTKRNRNKHHEKDHFSSTRILPRACHGRADFGRPDHECAGEFQLVHGYKETREKEQEIEQTGQHEHRRFGYCGYKVTGVTLLRTEQHRLECSREHCGLCCLRRITMKETWLNLKRQLWVADVSGALKPSTAKLPESAPLRPDTWAAISPTRHMNRYVPEKPGM